MEDDHHRRSRDHRHASGDQWCGAPAARLFATGERIGKRHRGHAGVVEPSGRPNQRCHPTGRRPTAARHLDHGRRPAGSDAYKTGAETQPSTRGEARCPVDRCSVDVGRSGREIAVPDARGVDGDQPVVHGQPRILGSEGESPVPTDEVAAGRQRHPSTGIGPGAPFDLTRRGQRRPGRRRIRWSGHGGQGRTPPHTAGHEALLGDDDTVVDEIGISRSEPGTAGQIGDAIAVEEPRHSDRPATLAGSDDRNRQRGKGTLAHIAMWISPTSLRHAAIGRTNWPRSGGDGEPAATRHG